MNGLLLWGTVAGALVGWAAARFNLSGGLLGAFVGAGLGAWLRELIRAEISASQAVLAAQWRRWADAPPPNSIQRPSSVAKTEAAHPTEPDAADLIRRPAESQPIDRLTVESGEPIAAHLATLDTLSSQPFGTRAPTPRTPSGVERVLGEVRRWLFGGNTIVRAGLFVLFIGLSFLARYAASAGLFPVQLRLATVGLIGLALLTVGFARRVARPAFGLALQGTGVAVIYLTIFAAARLYDVVPPVAAFAIMVIVSALGCALAILQGSQTLAIASFIGGFAVPILLSTKDGSSIGLFGYYTVLNLAVLAVARLRSWRAVTFIGFVATFGVAAVWGLNAYKPDLYVSSQLFLAGFVLIYVVASVLGSRHTTDRRQSVLDAVLLFGPALAGFALQTGLVESVHFGSAFSALAFAALYVGVAAATFKRGDRYQLLADSSIAIAIGFVTLAVPLALGVRWTSSTWALEGAAAFWVGRRQTRWMFRAFGLLLMTVAAGLFIRASGDNVSSVPLIGPATIGAFLISIPLLATAWWLRRSLPTSGSRWATSYANLETRLGAPVFLLGFAFWCVALVLELSRRVPAVSGQGSPVFAYPGDLLPLTTMVAVLSSAVAADIWGRTTAWPVATWPGRVTLVLVALVFALRVITGDHILYLPDIAFWITALGMHAWLLFRNDSTRAGGLDRMRSPFSRAMHVGGVWLMLGMIADCLWLGIYRAQLWRTSWAAVVLLVSSVGTLLILSLWAGRAKIEQRRQTMRWPLNPYASAYYWAAALPLAALVYVGALAAGIAEAGRTDPLPYVPVINPIDVTLGLAIGALFVWRRVVVAADPQPAGASILLGTPALLALAALAFVAINTVWLRIASHYLHLPWTYATLAASHVVQAGLTILWTVLALALMLLAHRRGQRGLWIGGASLLALVVAKLFLVDLSSASGVARIITFVVVGGLMLIVGYFVPLPPRSSPPPAETTTEAASG